MHQCIKFIYFGMALYMFRTVFPSIIRSSRLYIQQRPNRYCSNLFSLEWQSTCFGRSFHPSSGVQDCTYSNGQTDTAQIYLVWNGNLHVSDGLSVHHQNFKTVYIATVKQILLYSLANKQTAVSVWQMPVAVCTVLNCWWWTERPSETCRVPFPK